VRDNLLTVPPDHPDIALEFVLGLGYVGLLFAAFGARHSRSAARKALVVLTLVALALSLGPTLHLGRHPILIPLSDRAATAVLQALDALGAGLPAGETFLRPEGRGVPLPMPALALRWIVPGLTGLRGWNRFAVFVQFGVAVLAGLGFAAWAQQERPPGTGRRALKAMSAALALAAATFELWPGPIPLQPVRPRAVDLWLAQQPGEFSIMELPLASALSAPQMLYTRYHGKRTAFAYGTYFPYWYRQSFPELARCPAEACLERLESWGVRYILLNREALSGSPHLESDLNRSPRLVRVASAGQMVVYGWAGEP
jgi:hypothetical protein